MLIHLSVENFAIASHLETELEAGMTVITGETGAGKSIMLDALGLALGDRSDSSVVRHGAKRADIHATFDLSNIPNAMQWLQERELCAGSECLLRRVITMEGRSRAYINSHPATLQDLKTLGNMLIDIHSQHAHQSLLKKEQQRQLLDDYAKLGDSNNSLKKLSQQYQQQRQQLNLLLCNREEQGARVQLLSYQVEELNNLALAETELETLEQEQKQLASGEEILHASQHALALCKEGEINVINILNQALSSLANLNAKSAPLTEAEQLLRSALIQTEEASDGLQQHLDNFELNPQRLHELENRLSDIYNIARKHHINAKQLPALHRDLQQELNNLAGSDEDIEQLQQQLSTIEGQYHTLANGISKQRKTAAKKLQQQVQQQLAELAMENCEFTITLNPREQQQPHSGGNEDVIFLVSTNPGQEPQPLARIASGGELSRISLAIQVVTAKTSATPTLVFDEVDVGIGGATAEVVGNLLRTLGESGQVLCVTHQAQVASKGHQHLFVSKKSTKREVKTKLELLSDNNKIEEIARMLGGIAITEHTRSHAREMLMH